MIELIGQPEIIKNNMTNHLSFESVSDTIRSLAIAYGTDEGLIEEIYYGNWPDFLDKNVEDEIFTDNRLTWIMSEYMGAGGVMSRDISAAYYHRSCYDGNADWFKDGLLNSLEGTTAFLERFRLFIPASHDFAVVKNTALANVYERNSYEGSMGGGPYAFDQLEDAMRAQVAGLNYSTPEFFLGKVWKTNDNPNESATDLIAICLQDLKPVIVKFLAKPNNIDCYINNLWRYLHRKRFVIEFSLQPDAYTFSGRGQTVPYDQIIELITDFKN